MTSATLPALADYATMRQLAPLAGSYSTVYQLGTAGKLGEAFSVGRTQLFHRQTAERAIRAYLDRRRRRSTGRLDGTPPTCAMTNAR